MNDTNAATNLIYDGVTNYNKLKIFSLSDCFIILTVNNYCQEGEQPHYGVNKLIFYNINTTQCRKKLFVTTMHKFHSEWGYQLSQIKGFLRYLKIYYPDSEELLSIESKKPRYAVN